MGVKYEAASAPGVLRGIPAYSGVPRALLGVLVGTHRMPSIHPDQLKAEGAEAAELMKKPQQLESDGLGRLPALDLTFPGHG
jgi:hypothetical protein